MMYAIAWQGRSNGKSGVGKKFFEKEEAEQLAAELNRDYPEYCHEAVSTEVVVTPELISTLCRKTAEPEETLPAELETAIVEITP